MNDLRQAAQQALEALEMMRDKYGAYACPACDYADTSITVLRAALAEPEQEPFGYFSVNDYGRWEENESEYGEPLYTAPTPRRPLTDEEIDKLPWGPHEGNPMTFAEGLRDFARAIERAHGIGEQT